MALARLLAGRPDLPDRGGSDRAEPGHAPDWGPATRPHRATTSAYPLIYTLALLGWAPCCLRYRDLHPEFAALGRLGLIGYLIAFIGTLMVAGDWWFEAYAIPKIATEAPEFLDLPPSGSALVGVIATVGLYTVGWTLFGAAPSDPAPFRASPLCCC